MKGVRFGNFHSYDDFLLVLTQKRIGAPSPKINQIEIEGGDGVLDLTEFFGEVKYKNRSLEFDFASNIAPEMAMYLYSVIQDSLQGQKVPIMLDDDNEWYYVGRVTVSEWKTEKNIGSLTFQCDCEPYKYKIIETVVTDSVSGRKIFTLKNSRKRVVPTITTTSEMKFAFGSTSYTISAGTFIIPEFELKEGDNSIEVTGNGTVTFVYREGRL